MPVVKASVVVISIEVSDDIVSLPITTVSLILGCFCMTSSLANEDIIAVTANDPIKNDTIKIFDIIN